MAAQDVGSQQGSCMVCRCHERRAPDGDCDLLVAELPHARNGDSRFEQVVRLTPVGADRYRTHNHCALCLPRFPVLDSATLQRASRWTEDYPPSWAGDISLGSSGIDFEKSYS